MNSIVALFLAIMVYVLIAHACFFVLWITGNLKLSKSFNSKLSSFVFFIPLVGLFAMFIFYSIRYAKKRMDDEKFE